jgi:tetratricopeptide (TPR) repeat protein
MFVSLSFALFQYGWWATHRTRFIEDIKGSVPHIVGANAVVLGPLAPLLMQDTPIRSLPYYGPPGEKGLIEKYGVTHVVVVGAGDAKQLEDRYPTLMDQLQIVQAWPMRTLFSSTLEIYRVPPTVDGVPVHSYQPTTFERASEAVDQGRWQDAINTFAELRAEGGKIIPEVLSLEAVSSFKLDDLARARVLFEQAIQERPMDPLNYQNLGVIELREGNRSAAIRNWVAALQLDSSNAELEKQIKELLR